LGEKVKNKQKKKKIIDHKKNINKDFILIKTNDITLKFFRTFRKKKKYTKVKTFFPFF
jgi:hypothetical protein